MKNMDSLCHHRPIVGVPLPPRLSISCQTCPVNTLKPRLLLVEDTPDIALWLATALRQSGLEVTHAGDGLDALDALVPGHGFDVVVLDLQLPGKDGLQVLQALREQGDEVPVLVLTARAAVPDRVLGLQLGADDYLTKPFDPGELEAVEVLIHRLRRKLEQLTGEQGMRIATFRGMGYMLSAAGPHG